jgi:hypothetical protein
MSGSERQNNAFDLFFPPADPPDVPQPAPQRPAGDSQSYLRFLRETDGATEKRRFPVLAFVFMLTMAIVVTGLGLNLAVDRAGDLIPNDPSGADAAGGSSDGRSGDVPFCKGVTDRAGGQIDSALIQMRRTSEGARLAKMLAKHDVCIGVEDLEFNSGYASAERSWTGSWDDSYIAIDEDLLSIASADVVAALLVHEATHIDRYISGDACGAFDGCEVLDNGVVLEEEIAAHAAEAEWWIDVYGPNGRRTDSAYGYSLNLLATAYRQGDAAFRDFVREVRSDPRDGAGI